MKINFDQLITNLDDEPVKERTENEDGKRGPDKELSLGRVCVQALTIPTDEKIDGEESITRFELAKKIHAGGEIDLKTDEIAKIKTLIAKVYNVTVVGRSFPLLEKDDNS